MGGIFHRVGRVGRLARGGRVIHRPAQRRSSRRRSRAGRAGAGLWRGRHYVGLCACRRVGGDRGEDAPHAGRAEHSRVRCGVG